MDKRIGVDIIQPIVPHYRVPLFELLSKEPELDLAVQVSEAAANGNKTLPLKNVDYHIRAKEKKILGAVWQTGMRLNKAKSQGDVLVVCGDVRYLSNYRLIFQAKRKKIAVIWWGHHQSAFNSRIKMAIRLFIVKMLADSYLCYTDEGKTFLRKKGFAPNRVFATGNTLDTNAVDKAIREWDHQKLETFKTNKRIKNKKVVLFCGRLNRKAKLQVLLYALCELIKKNTAYHLVVIGDGVMLEEWRNLANRLELKEHITWAGKITEQYELAPFFMTAKLFVYPGAIGLSLLHAFAYGLPVVTHGNCENHGPEFAAFQEGQNGKAFVEDDSGSLCNIISTVVEDEERLFSMGQNARETILNKFTMAKMVERYKDAIVRTSAMNCENHPPLC
jgi:glycosyltransferase involved in cell wall biosynthesis